MPSAEYEPPIPSQDFSFDSFQDINSGLEKAAEEYPIISPTFGSFFNTQNTKKRFRNPPGLSFKTVTDLPKFTYSIQTTPANINDYFDFDTIESTTESVPRYTYKVVDPEPKQYSYTILSGNADDQTPSATSGQSMSLLNNFNHHIYLSDLPVLFMIIYLCQSNLPVLCMVKIFNSTSLVVEFFLTLKCTGKFD